MDLTSRDQLAQCNFHVTFWKRRVQAVVLPYPIQNMLQAVHVHACKSAGSQFSFEGWFKLDFPPFV